MFLAIGWLERSFSAQKDLAKLARWWGRWDWRSLKEMSQGETSETIVGRLKNEFGYKSVKPYRIYGKEDGGAIMYYMIHATGHPDGPLRSPLSRKCGRTPPPRALHDEETWVALVYQRPWSSSGPPLPGAVAEKILPVGRVVGTLPFPGSEARLRFGATPRSTS